MELPGAEFLDCRPKARESSGRWLLRLLGFRVWIGEMEQTLLKGRTLTTIQYGSPEPAELLVIENAPEDYFEIMMRAGKLYACATEQIANGRSA